MLLVRTPHPTHGGVVLFQKAGDALVLLFLHEEPKRRSLDDHEDLAGQRSDLREATQGELRLCVFDFTRSHEIERIL